MSKLIGEVILPEYFFDRITHEKAHLWWSNAQHLNNFRRWRHYSKMAEKKSKKKDGRKQKGQKSSELKQRVKKYKSEQQRKKKPKKKY